MAAVMDPSTGGAYLVDMHEDGVGSAVAQFAAETGALGGEAGAQQLEALAQAGEHAKYAQTLAGHLEEICQYEDEEDSHTVMMIMSSMVKNVCDAAACAALVASLAAALAASQAEEQRPALRLRHMLHLFSFAPFPAAKLQALGAAFAYARATGQADEVSSVIGALSSLQKAWGVPAAEMRPLHLAASELLWAPEGGALCGERALAQLDRYLASFGAGDAAMAEAVPAARRAVAGLIQCEGVFGSDLLSLPAVAQLEGADAPAHALLKIFLTGTYGDYARLVAANGGLLGGLGLDAAQAGRRMRLQSLAALATRSAEGTMSYADIVADLAIEEGEVEEWVVEAIGAGVFEAQIDQLGRCVTTSKVARRTFGGEDWAALRAQLAQWRAAIGETVQHVSRYADVSAKAAASRLAAKAEA